MDNATRRQLLEQAKQVGYTGSILDVFQNPQVLDQFAQEQQTQQQPQPQMQVEMPTPPATTPNYRVPQPKQSEAQPLVMSNTEVPIQIKRTGGILYENGEPTPKYANANALYNSSKYNSVSEKTDVGKFNSVKFIPYNEAPLDLSGNDSFEIGDEHLYQGANFTVDDTGNFKLNKPEGKVKAITNKEEYYRMLNPDIKPVGYNVHEYSIGNQTFKNYGLVYDDPNKKVEPVVQPTVIPTPKVREVAINKTDYSNKLGQSANRKYRWDPNLKKYQEVLETGGKKCYTCMGSKMKVLYNKANYKK